jgi:hypothetical protein
VLSIDVPPTDAVRADSPEDAFNNLTWLFPVPQASVRTMLIIDNKPTDALMFDSLIIGTFAPLGKKCVVPIADGPLPLKSFSSFKRFKNA